MYMHAATELALTFSYWVEFEWLLSLNYRARRAEKVNIHIHTHTLLTFHPSSSKKYKARGWSGVDVPPLLRPSFPWVTEPGISFLLSILPSSNDRHFPFLYCCRYFLLSPPSHFQRSTAPAAATVIFFTFNSSGWAGRAGGCLRDGRGRPVESSDLNGRLGRSGEELRKRDRRGGEGRDVQCDWEIRFKCKEGGGVNESSGYTSGMGYYF